MDAQEKMKNLSESEKTELWYTATATILADKLRYQTEISVNNDDDEGKEVGTFIFKRLTHMAMIQIGIATSARVQHEFAKQQARLGQTFNIDTNLLDNLTYILINKIETLRIVIVESPEWFDLDNGHEMNHVDAVYRVFDDWRRLHRGTVPKVEKTDNVRSESTQPVAESGDVETSGKRQPTVELDNGA